MEQGYPAIFAYVASPEPARYCNEISEGKVRVPLTMIFDNTIQHQLSSCERFQMCLLALHRAKGVWGLT